MRISKHQLIQPLDVEVGQKPDAVIMDESTGAEIVLQSDTILRALVALDYIGGTRLRPILPGDLVENLQHPELDYRIVMSTGIAHEDSQYVEEGHDYVTLDFGSSRPSDPLPMNLYKVVKPRDYVELDAL